MKKLEFTAEDFDTKGFYHSKEYLRNTTKSPLAAYKNVNQKAAEIAQAKFEKWFKENIENAAVVYRLANGLIFEKRDDIEYAGDLKPTHAARLVDIREI